MTEPVVAELPGDRLAWWLERAAGGDDAAMARVYDATCADVHRLALLIERGDQESAATLVRRAYSAVWRCAPGWDPAARTARTWVLALTWSVGHGGADDAPVVA